MADRKLRRPSVGTVLGFTALIVAVVGTASATPSRTIIRKGDLAKGSVTAKAIAKGAVKAKALSKGAVTQKAVGKGSIGDSALSSNAVTAAALSPGSVYGGALGTAVTHSSPITDIDTLSESSTWTPSGSVVAQCAPGERVISGGVVVTAPGNGRVAIIQSASTDSGWVGQITSDANGAAKAEVQVLCLK